MDWFEVFVMSVVEGITEFLPVSSTGHLIMTAGFLGIEQSEFVKSFEIAIQSGAITAVALLYADRIRRNISEAGKIAVAFIPTAVVGFVGYELIKIFFLGSGMLTTLMLFAGGVAILWFDEKISGKSGQRKIADLSYKEAVVLGIIQAIAVIPGVSRALVTIWGGMGMGLSKKEAVEMSFLLAVPTMAAAAFYDLLRSGWQFSYVQWWQLGAGFVMSMTVAALAVKWFLGLVQQKGMRPFGWYRILAAGIFWLFVR